MVSITAYLITLSILVICTAQSLAAVLQTRGLYTVKNFEKLHGGYESIQTQTT